MHDVAAFALCRHRECKDVLPVISDKDGVRKFALLREASHLCSEDKRFFGINEESFDFVSISSSVYLVPVIGIGVDPERVSTRGAVVLKLLRCPRLEAVPTAKGKLVVENVARE